MCTLSWQIQESGYELFFNRDERRTRGTAAPPEVLGKRGCRYIAPLDADAKGTWIGVNEHGTSVCLLNFYAAGASAGSMSRGRIPIALLEGRPLDILDLHRFEPFTVFVAEPSSRPIVLRWNGDRLIPIAVDPVRGMLTSSSLDQRKAQNVRESIFAGSDLRTFHVSHAPQPGPWSVCMHREDAETVSFTHIRVNELSIDLTYQPGAPCLGRQSCSLSFSRHLSVKTWPVYPLAC